MDFTIILHAMLKVIRIKTQIKTRDSLFAILGSCGKLFMMKGLDILD